MNEWFKTIKTSKKCYNYRLFKFTFGIENYLTTVPVNMSRCMLRFRTRNNRLPIEKGLFEKIPLEDRCCHLCHQDIGDEYHYLLVCNELKTLRQQLVKKYYYSNPNTLKFNALMNTRNKKEYKNLCTFIKHILSTTF